MFARSSHWPVVTGWSKGAVVGIAMSAMTVAIAMAATAAVGATPLAWANDTVRIGYVSPQTGPLAPFGEASPIQGFLDKNPAGGIHHICYEVDDILAARDRLKESGARVLGTGEPKIGAHGKPVLFLHPKDFNGCLVELEQV